VEAFIAWAYVQITTNQFLVGGVATVGFGYLAYISQYVMGYIKRFGKRFFTMKLTVNSTDKEIFQAVVQHLDNIKTEKFRKSYAISSLWKDSVLHWVLGPGYTYELYRRNGIYLIVNRSHMSDQGGGASDILKEQIEILFISRNKKKLYDFVDAAKKFADTKENEIKIYGNDNEYWYKLTSKLKRDVDTVILNSNTKKIIMDKVDWFIHNREWYLKRGLNYKIGILFYGPPGCGKSSFAFALASHYNKSIYCLNLSSSFDKSISQLFSDASDSILLIEDIDTFQISKDRKKDKKGRDLPFPVSMSTLLNVFDGVISPDNVIIIATTNYLDQLDPALIREGRFDLKVEFESLDKESIVSLFKLYHNDDITCLLKYLDTYVPISGAKTQSIIMGNDPETAAKLLCNVGEK
jgi:SpoVK/Ycf46/Vps4 family AAA+-type ATPase